MAELPIKPAFHSSGMCLTKEMKMEYEEDLKLERRRYFQKAILAVFICAALAALGAWLIQPQTASATLPLSFAQPVDLTVSV
jgi:ferric-dicitrate binding protein FerR (iron transport regulator)